MIMPHVYDSINNEYIWTGNNATHEVNHAYTDTTKYKMCYE